MIEFEIDYIPLSSISLFWIRYQSKDLLLNRYQFIAKFKYNILSWVNLSIAFANNYILLS